MATGQAKLAVGIVGFGDVAGYHLRHLRAAGADVVGVVTHRPTPAGVRRYATLDDLLPDVQAVTIAVPNHLHARFALAALAMNKAVFVEKPLCLTGDELAEMEKAIRANNAAVRVGFRLRWNPALRSLRQRLRGVRRVSCVYRLGIERLAKDKAWTRRAAESGGSFFMLGVHALDLGRWLAGARGERFREVQASTAEQTPAADFPLVARLAGTLPNGTTVEAAADLRGDAPFRLEIAVDASAGRYPDATLPEPQPDQEEAADAEYAAMMADFVDAALRRDCDHEGMAEMLETHRILLAARGATRSQDA